MQCTSQTIPSIIIGMELLWYEYYYHFCPLRYSYLNEVYSIGKISHKIVCGIKLSSFVAFTNGSSCLSILLRGEVYGQYFSYKQGDENLESQCCKKFFFFLISYVNKEKSYASKHVIPASQMIHVLSFISSLLHKAFRKVFPLIFKFFSQSCYE